MKTCPFCAEKIQNEATKCRFCGEFIDNVEKSSEHTETQPGSQLVPNLALISKSKTDPLGLRGKHPTTVPTDKSSREVKGRGWTIVRWIVGAWFLFNGLINGIAGYRTDGGFRPAILQLVTGFLVTPWPDSLVRPSFKTNFRRIIGCFFAVIYVLLLIVLLIRKEAVGFTFLGVAGALVCGAFFAPEVIACFRQRRG